MNLTARRMLGYVLAVTAGGFLLYGVGMSVLAMIAAWTSYDTDLADIWWEFAIAIPVITVIGGSLGWAGLRLIKPTQ